ncbi:MAG: PAS domain S-box protein, partial [Verrucomicrobiota bacterium]|nr:PAS domain S-box protein [Verrucomicrobiota bacterium]
MTNPLRDPESARVAKWRVVSRILGGALLAIAFLVIAGWVLGVESLRSGAPGLPPTKVNTAFGFIALGLWLAFLWRGEKSNRPLGALCWGCGLFTALLGLCTLAEYFSGGDFGIDQFLFGAGLPNPDGTFPTRMAPTTALNFVLLGTGILFLQKETARMFSVAQWAALLSLGTSFCAVIGYGDGIKQFDESAPFAPMALSTAVGFLIAGFGFLVGTAKIGWMSAAVAETSGGWLLRRLVPLTLAAATALGWLRLRGEVLGWYRPAIGTALLVLILVAIYSTALWINSRLIDRADAEAQHHREWLRVTLSSIGDAVIATDLRGRVTFLNSIAESLTGWDATFTHGQPIDTIFSLVDEATGEPCVSPVPEVLRTGERVGLTNQTALLSKDGTRTSIADSAAPIRDAAGRMIGVVMVFRDVTERRRAQLERRRAAEAVRISDEQYRLLFSSMNEGFCTIEMIFDEANRPVDYRFLEINPMFERQTGLSDAKGKRIRELAPGHEQHWFDSFGEIALTGKPARFENRAEALGRWYEVSAFRVGAPELRRVGIVFNDITERKRREDELREAAERFRFLAESMPQKIFTA